MSQIRIRKARRPFTAQRDENGVPHIQAAQWLDALYGLGYLHAWDRGTQLLFARSVAEGRGAEQIADSPELLETDQFFRRVGLNNHLDEEVASLEPRIREQLVAYCDGINDGTATAGRSLPMWATGYQPEPWTPTSVMLIGKLLSFGGLAVSQMQNERLLVELIHAGAHEDTLRELFGQRLDGVDLEMLRTVKIANKLSDDALELITDLPRLAGSNAWAVGPGRSASGHALLASDPHLEINRLPAIWYEAALAWGDGQYVMGATLPGCPLFSVARTPQLAWGVTYMKGDTIDYFIEECRSANGENGAHGENGDDGIRWQYRRGERWVDFRVREERIQRKGGDPLAFRVYENDQGRMEGDLESSGPGLHLSLSWSGSHEGNGGAMSKWLDVIHASDTRDAMEIVKHCEQPTLCWVFADCDGHIGMQSCGRFPKRGGGQIGLAPIPAWDEANHWQGWLPADLLPSVYDPPEGYLATANEELNPPAGPMLVTQPLPDYRLRRIEERLAEMPQATLDDMQALQYDLVSVQARDLLALFLPELPEGPFKEQLSQWDCSYQADSREATLFQKFYRFVIMEALGHDQGIGWRRALYLCSRSGFSLMVLCATDRMLKRKHSAWWKDRDWGEMIRQAAERAQQEKPEPWSAINNFHFTDRFFGTHQVGRLLGFNSRSYPMAGNHATPFQGHVLQTATRESTFAPSYHFVTDMGEDIAWTNLPGGPSESRFSKYYKIDVARWFHGQYKALLPSGEKPSNGSA